MKDKKKIEKFAVFDRHSYNQSITKDHTCSKYYKLKCPIILKLETETAIEKKTPDHDCESIGGKVSYFRNSSILNGRCSSWQRNVSNF